MKTPLLALLLAAPVAAAPAPVVVTNGRIVTVSGPTYDHGAVLVRDGKIAAIGPDVAVPEGATVIDAKGGTIYPGLIDALTTLGLREIDSVSGSLDVQEVGPVNPQAQAWLAVHPESELIPVSRANGLTAAVVAPSGTLVSGQAALIRLAGDTTDALKVRAPIALVMEYPTGAPSFSFANLFSDAAEQKTFEQWQKEAKKNQEKDLLELRDLLEAAKARAAGLANPSSPAPRPDLVLDALAPAALGKIPVIMRADREADIRGAVKFAKEAGLKLIVAGGLEAWRCVDALKGVPVLVKVLTRPSRESDTYDAASANPAALAKAGVPFAIVSDGASDARNLPYEAAMARAFGLPADQALRAITLSPAEILGVAEEMGSLAVGRAANLFVATGDIMDARTQVTAVLVDGVPQSLETRHTRFYKEYKDRP
jgi:imidazolonepropionase-like amidohydrolase